MFKNTGDRTTSSNRMTSMSKNKAAQIAVKALEDKKGLDVKIINLESSSGLADALVIATGTSETHVGTLADNVELELSKAGLDVLGTEGSPANQWVLVDAVDVIIHVFLPDTRKLYNLEKMWGHDFNDFDGDDDWMSDAG